MDGLSDITVSSVHTSDLSSFDGESEDNAQMSESSEEGELLSDGLYFFYLSQYLYMWYNNAKFVVKMFLLLWPDQDEEAEKKNASEEPGAGGKHKARRKAYVHKPFLYSRYYSDSDDEVTVEERRRNAVCCPTKSI